MWCVIQVSVGKEREICEECKKLIDGSVLSRAFVPLTVRLRKYKSEWRKVRLPLYPGYVFLVTEEAEALDLALSKVPGFHKLLKAGRDILCLSAEEQMFLEKICDGDMVADLSVGYKDGDKIYITSGPLVGLEGSIVRIDRHKRIATVNVTIFGRVTPTTMGLEVMNKVSDV
ncbi:MAG: antiterminator LoaP [Saccharofermentans sp.]|nr:antiterminator LoaP [Saccharofermentans sp.]